MANFSKRSMILFAEIANKLKGQTTLMAYLVGRMKVIFKKQSAGMAVWKARHIVAFSSGWNFLIEFGRTNLWKFCTFSIDFNKHWRKET